MRYAKSSKHDPISSLPESASPAEKIASHVGDTDWFFRRPILNGLPDRLSIPVAKRYVDIHRSKSRFDANTYMLDVRDDLTSYALSLSASDDEIVSYAKKAARDCFYQGMRFRTAKATYDFLIDYVANRYKINPPLAYKIATLQTPVTLQ